MFKNLSLSASNLVNNNQTNCNDLIDFDFNFNTSSIYLNQCKCNKSNCKYCNCNKIKRIHKEKKPREKKIISQKPFSDKLNLYNALECKKPDSVQNKTLTSSKITDYDLNQQIEIFKPIIRNKIFSHPKPSETSPTFDWSNYLKKTNSKAVPEKFFSNPCPSKKNVFKVGMRLEGIKPDNNLSIYVFTISQVKGHRLKLSSDCNDQSFELWRNADSNFIFPIGHASSNKIPLIPLKGYNFNLMEYLNDKFAAPKSLFLNKQKDFLNNLEYIQIGMKLEAVDKHNPSYIRVASVIEIKETSLKIHYDGWPSACDVWFDKDSEDLHPINWCSQTGHPLEIPIYDYEPTNTLCSDSEKKSEPIKKQKRGRPCKNPEEKLENKAKKARLDELEKSYLIDQAELRRKEIRESVYLTQTPEDSIKSQTLSFKYDSQLAYGDLEKFLVNNINILSWSVQDVYLFVKSIPACENVAEFFLKEEIDGEALNLIKLSDLVNLMKLKFGPALKIYNYIMKLKYY